MKTRVMQDDTSLTETKAHVDPVSPEEKRTPNAPARIGAWSDGHWKRAVFGSLAFAAAALAIALAVGYRCIQPNGGHR